MARTDLEHDPIRSDRIMLPIPMVLLQNLRRTGARFFGFCSSVIIDHAKSLILDANQAAARMDAAFRS